MRHIFNINEWKKPEHSKLDTKNVSEIEDIFLPILDLGSVNFQVIIDEHIEESYNIKWNYPINLNIGSYPDKVTLKSIQDHKKRLVEFNSLQEETHDILERLISIGYDIAYYSVDSGVDHVANPLFKFEIRLSKKNNI